MNMLVGCGLMLESDVLAIPCHACLQGVFTVSARTGVVSVAAALDFESVPVYNLTIQATDATYPLRTAAGSVLITVLDVNDNDPVFAASEPTEDGCYVP